MIRLLLISRHLIEKFLLSDQFLGSNEFFMVVLAIHANEATCVLDQRSPLRCVNLLFKSMNWKLLKTLHVGLVSNKPMMSPFRYFSETL